MAESKKGKPAGPAAKAGAEKKEEPRSAPKTEERDVKSEDLLEELKKLVHEGNVRRIIVRNKDGRELLNFPLSAGIVGVLLLPFWAAVAAIVGLAKEFTIVIERRE